MDMKIQMKRDVLVDVNKTKLGEVWNKALQKWDVLRIEEINPRGETSDLVNYDGDVFIDVPTNSFEVI